MYYFEVDDDVWPVRQIEVYDAGPVLRYGPERVQDSFGSLGDQPLGELDEWSEWEIPESDFDQLWGASAS
jgi:hypothetical protein